MDFWEGFAQTEVGTPSGTYPSGNLIRPAFGWAVD